MKLVIEEKIKTIEKSGDENIIFTNEDVSKAQNIITKETVIQPNEEVEITINEETFFSEVGTENRTYVFEYNADENAWFYREEEIDLTTYGITIDGEEIGNKDHIVIVVENETILSKAYCPYIQLIDGFIDSSFFDFISELPVNLEFGLFPEQAGDFMYITETTKVQLNYKKQSLLLGMWHNNTKDFKIKLVVSE